MIKFEIRNRFTGNIQFTAEIDCSDDEKESIKLGLAVKWAFKNSVDLIGANLERANLIGANLERANLEGANLEGVNLEGVNLEDGPVIENIHQKVHEAVKGGKALDMGNWHNDCGTKHCRAGWVVTLAGKEGRELEEKIGTPAAAYVIYRSSDPGIKVMPDFYCSDEEAMEDIVACAEREKEKLSVSKREA